VLVMTSSMAARVSALRYRPRHPRVLRMRQTGGTVLRMISSSLLHVSQWSWIGFGASGWRACRNRTFATEPVCPT
jgi:hypothetical protein